MAISYLAATPAQLGQLLRGFRRERKLTQAAAARRAGLNPKTVSAMEVQPQTITADSLFRLLSALEIQLLVQRKPGATPPPAP